MSEIIAIVGSRRGDKSTTYTITKKILEKIKFILPEINYEIITPNSYNIKQCIGCNTCFEKGYCSITDDMTEIKNKIISAKIIIIGSPVYAHNVTGDIKTFIDRISSWLHLYKLAGKYSINIFTSTNNGNMFVDYYLKETLEAMGAHNLATISLKNNNYDIYNDYIVEKDIEKYVDLINDALNGKIKIKPTFDQESSFNVYKDMYMENIKKGIIAYEETYWKDSGLMKCDNYQEFLLKRSDNNRY